MTKQIVRVDIPVEADTPESAELYVRQVLNQHTPMGHVIDYTVVSVAPAEHDQQVEALSNWTGA